MLQEGCVSERLLALTRKLEAEPIFGDYFLVGGTALALLMRTTPVNAHEMTFCDVPRTAGRRPLAKARESVGKAKFKKGISRKGAEPQRIQRKN